jgi:uncharacterized protein DUF4388
VATGNTPRVQGTLLEFQRYLQDEIPPASGADALAVLMAQPPDVLMQQVAMWAVEQSKARQLAIRDLLLHALKKVYITGEMQLLDREAVANYLDRVTGVALRICPVEDRDELRNSLTAMRMSRDTGMVRPTPTPTRTPTLTNVPLPMTEEAQAAKRYSLIFDRLHQQMQSNPQQGAPDPQAFAQLLTMAATRSQNGQQLNQYLEQLRPLTGGKEGNVFVILGGAMPSWDLPPLPSGAPAKPPSQVGAMEKIIDLAENPTVALKRLRELVTAAVEKFNEGSLAAAVWMLDVAETTINDKKLDIAVVDQIRSDAVAAISAVQLRKYAENKTKHAAVKIVLEFFPTLHLGALYQRLRGEQRAEERRTILGFIEAYGVAGREEALSELERELARGDVDTYYLRNLIYILHRVNRESGETVEREFAALSKATERGQNIYVMKEAATALGQIRTEAAVKVLTTRLAECESMLLRNDAEHPAAELQKLMDRIVSSLARIGTSTALLTIARHGMKANPQLGDTRARLATLSQHDLSFDEETVDILLKALRDEIPSKLLGRFIPKKQDATIRIIEALSGTKSEEVEDVLRDIAQRFSDQDVGRAAAEVLAKWSPAKAAATGPRSEPAATLTGELEFFGLPSVLQSLADMRATGILTLSNKQRQAASKMIFVDGKFVNGQTGHVRGVDALYESLERPVTGTFAFVPHPPEKLKTDHHPYDIVSVLLEGVRRHDELQQYLAEIPDSAAFTKTNVRPTPHEDEKDPGLIREIWLKASSGAPVSEWERQLPSDSYRVRRMLAHWLELGALATK